jgi:hypothetical protein
MAVTYTFTDAGPADKRTVRIVDDMTWNEAVIEVLNEYSGAWDKLSGYTKEQQDKDARKKQYEQEIRQARLRGKHGTTTTTTTT